MVKDYKEPSDRPFEEIPVSPEQLDRFKEEDNMHYQSEERKEYREKTKIEASKWIKIVIECLHKHKEKAIFNLYFVENKPLWEVEKELKIARTKIARIALILKKKLPKIYQASQLFEKLKEKLKDNLTQAEYQAFELHYNKWMSYDRIRKKLNLETKTGIKFRIRNGEGKLKDALKKEDWEQYLQLKEIRRT